MANQMGNKQSSSQDLVFEDYSKRNFICPNESIRCDFSLEPAWRYGYIDGIQRRVLWRNMTIFKI